MENKLQVIEYQEGDRIVRLFFRRHQDPPTIPAEISNLSCELLNGSVYRVFFYLAVGRLQFHEYPLHEVVRCESVWPRRKT